MWSFVWREPAVNERAADEAGAAGDKKPHDVGVSVEAEAEAIRLACRSDSTVPASVQCPS